MRGDTGIGLGVTDDAGLRIEHGVHAGHTCIKSIIIVPHVLVLFSFLSFSLLPE